MRKLLLLHLTVLLIACASNNDTRYRDNSELERPPTVAIDPKDAELAASELTETPRKRHGKGLKSDVFKVQDSEVRFRIKRLYDESWGLVDQALQLRELKIPDQDRSKGVYYVEFDGRGFLSQAASFFATSHKPATYLVRLTSEGDETEVTVGLANSEEQTSKADLKDGVNTSDDASASLTQVLFDTLEEEVKEE